MAKSETISLPMLPPGRVYIDIADNLLDGVSFSFGLEGYKIAFQDFPESSRDGTIVYGAKRWANDAQGQGTDSEKAERVRDRIDAIQAGTVGTRAGGGTLNNLTVSLRSIVTGLAVPMYPIGAPGADARKVLAKAINSSPRNAMLDALIVKHGGDRESAEHELSARWAGILNRAESMAKRQDEADAEDAAWNSEHVAAFVATVNKVAA